MLVILVLFPLLSRRPLDDGIWSSAGWVVTSRRRDRAGCQGQGLCLTQLSAGVQPPHVGSTCTILAQDPLPANGILLLSNCLPFLAAGAKAFVCDQCGAQFSKEDALETHRQTHTGELADSRPPRPPACQRTHARELGGTLSQRRELQPCPGELWVGMACATFSCSREWGWLAGMSKCDLAP